MQNAAEAQYTRSYQQQTGDNQLPFTGAEAGLVLMLSMIVVIAGGALRRLTRP